MKGRSSFAPTTTPSSMVIPRTIFIDELPEEPAQERGADLAEVGELGVSFTARAVYPHDISVLRTTRQRAGDALQVVDVRNTLTSRERRAVSAQRSR